MKESFCDTSHDNDILTFLSSNKHSGIIYCRKIDRCIQLSTFLISNGISADYYHSNRVNKSIIHNKWLSGDLKVMVSTTAFGMGVHKEDVRYVIHDEMP